MKSYTAKRNQKSLRNTLKRDKNLNSDDTLMASSTAQRKSESSRVDLIKTRYTKSLSKTPPYDDFVKELRIRLPTPIQKFYEFLKIQPFNRIQNHNELIALFLKNIKFFTIHQSSLVVNLAKKVRLVEVDEIDQKMMVIVLQGECTYQGVTYSAGSLVNRGLLSSKIKVNPLTKLLAINRHEYLSFLSSFIHQELFKFKQFVNGIQLFKMFSEKTIQKFTENMSLHYYLKGEKLYKVGNDANMLYVIFSGKVSRKVVIEIEKVNKIPTRKFEKEVRILSKSYAHQIQFIKQDIVGVTQLIDCIHFRKQQIDVDEDTILIGIQRSIIQQNLDDYMIDRFKKYNLKKYPSNYDELCSNYEREKTEMKKYEERKILALQDEFKVKQNQKRREKIQSIIHMYQTNIKMFDNKNLLTKKLHFEVDYNK